MKNKNHIINEINCLIFWIMVIEICNLWLIIGLLFY
jgi:hypothetical protein